jgi:hypothetical protein
MSPQRFSHKHCAKLQKELKQKFHIEQTEIS